MLSHSVMSDSLWPHGLQHARLLCSWGFSRQEYWSELACPPPGDLPNPGIEHRSPALQAYCLPAELPGKPKVKAKMFHFFIWKVKVKSPSHVQLFETPWILAHGIFQTRVLEWVAISFSRGIFLTQGSNLSLPHCRQRLYLWATREYVYSESVSHSVLSDSLWPHGL